MIKKDNIKKIIAKKIKKDLNKMLRDNKNYDFRDQIYYALGNLYFNEGNRDVAIDNYSKSGNL